MGSLATDRYGHKLPNLRGSLMKMMIEYGLIQKENIIEKTVQLLNILAIEIYKREWRYSGFIHREDGPAVIESDGDVYWYIHGEVFSKDEWIQYLKEGKSSLNQKTILRLILEHS
jgi:hypothetical protein